MIYLIFSFAPTPVGSASIVYTPVSISMRLAVAQRNDFSLSSFIFLCSLYILSFIRNA